MPTPQPGRRAVLAGTAVSAAAAVLTAVPALGARAHAAGATVEGRAEAGAGSAARGTAYRWRNVVIGGTGFITGVLFHPSVRGLAYVRTDIGGAYRWDDRAARWTPLTDHIGWDDWNLLGVEAMAVDPAHPNRLYLALGTYTQPYASNGAVLRSEDRGATWTRSDLDVKLGANEDGRGTGERLLVDPRDSDTLWLGTRHDGGVSFTKVDSCWASYTVGFGRAARGAGYPAIYRVGSTGSITAVHRSDDEARTWVRINDDAHQWGWTGEVIVGDPRVYGRVYLATNGRGIQYGEPV